MGKGDSGDMSAEGMPIKSYKYASPDRYELLKQYAKELRNNPTVAETAIWGYLSDKKLGYGFRRQHIISDYIVDFVCLEKKLVVEIDGGYHLSPEQQAEDDNRTKVLSRIGFTELRFTNDEVYASPQSVADKIKQALEFL